MHHNIVAVRDLIMSRRRTEVSFRLNQLFEYFIPWRRNTPYGIANLPANVGTHLFFAHHFHRATCPDEEISLVLGIQR